MRKIKKTMANNPPEVAARKNHGIVFKRGRRPKERDFPIDPDRDKKIAEFLARKKDGQ